MSEIAKETSKVEEKKSVEVPKKKIVSLARRKILLLGRPKVGKTSFVMAFPGLRCLAFERGHDDLPEGVDVVEINHWSELALELTKIKTDPKATMFAIDTLDSAYKMFQKDFLKARGLEYEGDDKMQGRAWVMSRREFSHAMNDLQFVGKGYFLISHEKIDVTMNKKGEVVNTTIRANYPIDSQLEIKGSTVGIADAIWWIGWQNMVVEGRPARRRVIRTTPDDEYELGGRFTMPDVIELIEGDPIASFKKVNKIYQNGGKE